MSTIFYDHLVILDEVEAEIKKTAKTEEEKEELWRIVDEMVHLRVMGRVLEVLPRKDHEEFLTMFHDRPHDEGILDYLKQKIKENVEEVIRQEIGNLAYELLGEIRKKK